MFFELRELETDRAIGVNIVVDDRALYVEIYLIWFGICAGIGTPPDEQ